MAAFRILLFDRRWLAVTLVALALLTRAIVPSGYMVAPVGGAITVSICDGQGSHTIALDLGKAADHGGHQGGKTADHPCAFSGLGMAATTGADALLLGLAIAFILSLGFLAVPPRVSRPFSRLRPPLRAPPVFG